ncbi:MAG: transglycosylase SLT domain-containing protein [Rhizobiaceae bacterium]|nr:transglycosylase SLT domain-containing protein [Rhizobiaceae bacterium]
MLRAPRPLRLLAAAFTFSLAASAAAASANVCEQHIATAAARYDIPAAILYAVGLTETGRRGSLYPYALNIEGRSVFPRSAAEALLEFEKARSQGKTLIDLGCMQINHHYHADQFRSPREMLDPAANVDYAARFLKRLRGEHDTWSMAVARYHAGPNNDPAQKRYICRVIANLVATGFGQWTPQARGFCSSG